MELLVMSCCLNLSVFPHRPRPRDDDLSVMAATGVRFAVAATRRRAFGGEAEFVTLPDVGTSTVASGFRELARPCPKGPGHDISYMTTGNLGIVEASSPLSRPAAGHPSGGYQRGTLRISPRRSTSTNLLPDIEPVPATSNTLNKAVGVRAIPSA